MKRIILVALIGLLTLAVTLDRDDSLRYFQQTQQIQAQAVVIQELTAQAATRETEFDAETLSLREELARAEGIVSAVASLESIQAQIGSLTHQRNNLQSQVSSLAAQTSTAYAELNRVRAATARIDTMVAAFTPGMGIVTCGTFDGVSMEPTFDSNSLVCISNHPPYLATVAINDIVIGPAGCRADRHVIHRVVRRLKDAWVLKGDNPLNTEDPCALKDAAVFYKVTGFVKGAWW